MVSNLIKNMVPSVTFELNTKIRNLKRDGIDVINLSIGEPDFETPANIVEAAKIAMDKGYTKYTDVAGIIELRQAICKKMADDYSVTYNVDEIVVSTGAKQAIVNALLTLCNFGDEVILPTPCWVSYIEIIKLSGATPVLVPTSEKDNFQIDINSIVKAISLKTKAIIINTPNNPTGAVYTKDILSALGEVVLKNKLYVIADEIYEKLIYGDIKHISFASISPEIKERTITVNGLSKSYAMTGWRIGYSAASRDISKAITSLQGHMTSNANSIAQFAALEALTGPQEAVQFMRNKFNERRIYLFQRLRNIEDISYVEGGGAFYLLLNVSKFYAKSYCGKRINNAFDFCAFLLENAHVALVPGEAFGAPNYVRLSYSNSIENIAKGLDQIEEALYLLQ